MEHHCTWDSFPLDYFHLSSLVVSDQATLSEDETWNGSLSTHSHSSTLVAWQVHLALVNPSSFRDLWPLSWLQIFRNGFFETKHSLFQQSTHAEQRVKNNITFFWIFPSSLKANFPCSVDIAQYMQSVSSNLCLSLSETPSQLLVTTYYSS